MEFLACGAGRRELIGLMNYICIIDKLCFCPSSVNIYLYNVSLCLIVTGWPCVLQVSAKEDSPGAEPSVFISRFAAGIIRKGQCLHAD